MRISDWSSDVCSSDLEKRATAFQRMHNVIAGRNEQPSMTSGSSSMAITGWIVLVISVVLMVYAAFGYDTAIHSDSNFIGDTFIPSRDTINIGLLQNQLMMFQAGLFGLRSEEHTSELQSLMRISYDVFCTN